MELLGLATESCWPPQVQIELAGIVITCRPSDDKDRGIEIPAHHIPFLTDGQPDLDLSYERGRIPEQLWSGELLFDNHTMWSLHRNDRGLVWRQMSASTRTDPERVAVLSPAFDAGEVYIASRDLSYTPTAYPLYHPLDKFLVDSLLGVRHGVGCHACGVVDRGRGLLFVGESGSGKSTMAELWHGQPGVVVLSDERTIVRRQGEQFRIYGTPWYGTAGLYAADSAPLAAVFFLEHGPANRVTEIHAGEAVRRLLVCTYLPFWLPEAMERSLQVLHELILAVPCYRLTFVPHGKAIEFLRDSLQS